MGYYTYYKLTWEHADDVTYGRIGEYICDHPDTVGRAVDTDGESQEEPVKWYEHMRDMRAMSAEFPGVLFTLHGEGEEAGDLWRSYFRDGKGYSIGAVITYPEFDEAQLTDADPQ